MILDTHLLKAIRENRISKVAIVDDAFDAPRIEQDNAGQLLDFLQSEEFGVLTGELEIGEQTVRAALDAIAESEYDSDDVLKIVEVLYGKFVDTLDDRYDPKGLFQSQKLNIQNVNPILKLLAKCDPKIQVTRIGSDPDAAGFDEDTHLVFIDFYLKAGVSEEASTRRKTEAKGLAVAQVTRLIKRQEDNAASVILMSSANVRDDAETFRKGIVGDKDSLVFASRFCFVRKTDFVIDGDAVCIPHQAGDELLDVLQSFEFGRGTHAALEAWYNSAQDATKALRKEIAQLGLKDLAYLHRFRLSQEGQDILSYLEWFFGQCLLDELGRTMDTKKADLEFKSLSAESERRIEGTFDGPTQAIASLYHRARIEDPRGKHTEFRLGDLFMSGTGAAKKIRAVLNPDCDLVMRGGKRNSKRSITVSGVLKKFDEPDASVAEFIRLGNRSFNISWQKKNIEAVEFDELSKDEFVGTLRPLYAQELQRNVLSDLGRVGVSVSPAMGMSALASVFVVLADGKTKEIVLGQPKTADCYVMPGRGGKDKKIVLFKRSFASHLIAALSAEEVAELDAKAAEAIEGLKKEGAAAKLSKMHQSGAAFEDFVDTDIGILLTEKKSLKGEKPWCFIRVKMVEED